MKNFLLILSFALILIGVIILIYFFGILHQYYLFTGHGELKMDATGQTGDFIGGVIGTLFALSGTFLIYLSFREQTLQNKRETFESSFFEMLRLYRENVAELNYTKSNGKEMWRSENRKVFRVIFQEFTECYREVKKFYRFTNDFVTPEYDQKITTIINRINPQINKKEFVMIDIAYCIVFFGIGEEGERVLHHRFKNKYTNTHVFQLLEFLRLKLKIEDTQRLKNWVYIKSLGVKQLRALIKELYDYRRMKIMPRILNPPEYEFLLQNDYEKYYGGHQHRLGHYFRHLFQTYKYLHNTKGLNKKKKYFYGKTLRAQLSTYEQSLLFINSISSLGMKWEFTPEFENKKGLTGEELNNELAKNHLITEYALIKNLPGERILDLRYTSYYPKIKYEYEE